MLRTVNMMFPCSDRNEFRLKGQNCKLDAALPDEDDKNYDLEWIMIELEYLNDQTVVLRLTEMMVLIIIFLDFQYLSKLTNLNVEMVRLGIFNSGYFID